MKAYQVTYSQTCLKENALPNNEWQSQYEIQVNSVQRNSSPMQRVDLVSKLELNPGDEVFLVWAEYSEGDSLGWAKNSGFEALAIFTDIDSAQTFAQTIGLMNDKFLKLAQTEMTDVKWKPAKITCLDGQLLTLDNVPWNQQFANLDVVKFDRFTLK